MTFSNHHYDQSVAINIETRPSTSRNLNLLKTQHFWHKQYILIKLYALFFRHNTLLLQQYSVYITSVCTVVVIGGSGGGLITKSCLTLSDLMDCSLPGSSVHGISQARMLEWVVVSFSGYLPHPGIKLRFPALQAVSLPTDPPGKT